MGVMTNYSNVGKIVQNTINETQGTKLAVDGIIGRQTILALNNIPANWQTIKIKKLLGTNTCKSIASYWLPTNRYKIAIQRN